MLTKPKFIVGQLVKPVDWDGVFIPAPTCKVDSVFHNSITGRSRYRVSSLDDSTGGYFHEEDLVEVTIEDSAVTRGGVPSGGTADEFRAFAPGTILRSSTEEATDVVFITGGAVNIPYYMSLRFGSTWTVFDMEKRSQNGESFTVVGGLFDA